MNYNLNGKNIKIPDSEIQKSMKILGLTQEEAMQMYLEDEGYLDNEEQKQLDKKAKDNRITATIHQASTEKPKKKTQKERTHKENPTKEMIIAEIASFLPKFAENVQVLNVGKLITFNIGEKNFKIDLIETRTKKK